MLGAAAARATGALRANTRPESHLSLWSLSGLGREGAMCEGQEPPDVSRAAGKGGEPWCVCGSEVKSATEVSGLPERTRGL